MSDPSVNNESVSNLGVTVASVKGDVTVVTESQERVALSIKHPITSGSQVVTGDNSLAVFKLDNDLLITLGASSFIDITPSALQLIQHHTQHIAIKNGTENSSTFNEAQLIAAIESGSSIEDLLPAPLATDLFVDTPEEKTPDIIIWGRTNQEMLPFVGFTSKGFRQANIRLIDELASQDNQEESSFDTQAATDNIFATIERVVSSLQVTQLRDGDTRVVIEEDTVLRSSVNQTNINDAIYSVVSANTLNGHLSFSANGSYTFTPSAHFNGNVSFQYQVYVPETGEKQIYTVNIIVTPVADIRSVSESITVEEDSTTIGSLSTNNHTSHGGALTYSVEAQSASNGQFLLLPDGHYTYTPDANFHGADTYVYQIHDPVSGESVTETLQIIVTPVADLAVPSQTITLAEDSGPYSGQLAGSTTSGGQLSYRLADNGASANGVLTLNNDGSYTYQPNKNFSGEDSFQYVVVDPASGEAINETLVITVTPDIEIDASAANVVAGYNGIPLSSGLTYSIYHNLTMPTIRTATSTDASLQEGQTLFDKVPTSTQLAVNGFSSLTPIVPKSMHTITGLMYLEAGKTYQFVGTTDDILRIELGGQTMVSTTGNAFGNFGPGAKVNANIGSSAVFTPPENGYYTLETYVGNHGGDGKFIIDVMVNGVRTSLNTTNFSLYNDVDYLISHGGHVSHFVANTQNSDGGYFALNNTQVSFTGVEDRAVDVSSIQVNAVNGDALVATFISNLPVGTILSDGHYHFTATSQSSMVDITQWNLSQLTLTPPSNVVGLIELTIHAVTESPSFSQTTTSQPFTVNILPSTFLGSVDPDLQGNLYNELPADIGVELPTSTGLLVKYYNNVAFPESRTETSSSGALLETFLSTQSPQLITKEVIGFSELTHMDPKAAYSITGLVYLQAGKHYQFSGYADDILRIELGGTVMMSTTGNSSGSFSPYGTSAAITGSHISGGSFIAQADGYYTLEIHTANHGGNGGFRINIVVDGEKKALTGDNFHLYSTVEDLAQAGVDITHFVRGGDTIDGGYFVAAHTEADIADDIDIVSLDMAAEKFTALPSEIDGELSMGQSLISDQHSDIIMWNAEGNVDLHALPDVIIQPSLASEILHLADLIRTDDNGIFPNHLSIAYDPENQKSIIELDTTQLPDAENVDVTVIVNNVDLTAIGSSPMDVLDQLTQNSLAVSDY